MEINPTKLTRVALIFDGLGKICDFHGVEVEVVIQDDERTLKVFVKDNQPLNEPLFMPEFGRDKEGGIDARRALDIVGRRE